MDGPARIEIRLYHGDVIVHEFRRSTTMLQAGAVRKMAQDALGWLQAYSAQVSNDQFLMESRHAQWKPPSQE